MKILPAGSADYNELVEVWEASVRATHDFVSKEDILFFKPLITQYLVAADLWIVREENNILGFLGTAEKEVQMLYLRPEARGKGIGKLFMQFAITECSVTKVEVNEQNDQAVGFYKHVGFKVVGRSELDYTGKPYPLLIMELAW